MLPPGCYSHPIISGGIATGWATVLFLPLLNCMTIASSRVGVVNNIIVQNYFVSTARTKQHGTVVLFPFVISTTIAQENAKGVRIVNKDIVRHAF
jgi:hypothetical protein